MDLNKKYSITFPHVGDYYICFEYLMRNLGYNVILPPKSNKTSSSLGFKYSPSHACLPFKYMMGNIIQGLDEGADVVAMVQGDSGICRTVFFSEIYDKVLHDINYNFEILHLKISNEGLKFINKHCKDVTLLEYYIYVYIFIMKMKAIEFLRKQCVMNRPYEKNKGDSSALYKKFIPVISKSDTRRELKELKNKILKEFDKIPKDNGRDVIKIGLVGEVFLLNDQYPTHNLDSFMGESGVIIDHSMTLSDYFLGSIKYVKFIDKYFPTHRHKIFKNAKPFINCQMGGHPRETIGKTIEYAQKGYDGVIHLYPFSCMPEITASSILPKVGKMYDVPLISLCFDEHTGVAGLHTRLEAFIDMIKRKTNSKEYSQLKVKI